MLPRLKCRGRRTKTTGFDKKDKKCIMKKLMEINFRMDDVIYNGQTISASDAEMHLREIISLKAQCGDDVPIFQVIEKLTKFMRTIIEDSHDHANTEKKSTQKSGSNQIKFVLQNGREHHDAIETESYYTLNTLSYQPFSLSQNELVPHPPSTAVEKQPNLNPLYDIDNVETIDLCDDSDAEDNATQVPYKNNGNLLRSQNTQIKMNKITCVPIKSIINIDPQLQGMTKLSSYQSIVSEYGSIDSNNVRFTAIKRSALLPKKYDKVNLNKNQIKTHNTKVKINEANIILNQTNVKRRRQRTNIKKSSTKQNDLLFNHKKEEKINLNYTLDIENPNLANLKSKQTNLKKPSQRKNVKNSNRPNKLCADHNQKKKASQLDSINGSKNTKATTVMRKNNIKQNDEAISSSENTASKISTVSATNSIDVELYKNPKNRLVEGYNPAIISAESGAKTSTAAQISVLQNTKTPDKPGKDLPIFKNTGDIDWLVKVKYVRKVDPSEYMPVTELPESFWHSDFPPNWSENDFLCY